MASTTNNPISLIASSPDNNFVPRKEFVSSSTRQFSTFALLSFSSNNVIRATNFSHNVFTELKARLHSVIGLRAFRENPEHKLGEIILLDKPWSNAKSMSTEIVLVQVFTILLGLGYNLVSHINYGQEPNDRITLVFSQPIIRTAVHLEGNLSPGLQSGMAVFGLSITSATSLRVVCSPLTGTPAILQSIRGAWPKGVKSEKKLGEHCYEFKLKGNSWFQEDTFSEDAPRHILTILSSLDRYAWNLITSLNLSSSRSRTKDFWMFASHLDTPTHDVMRSVSLVNLGTPLKPNAFEPIEDGLGHASGGSEGSDTAAHSTEDLTMLERRANGISESPRSHPSFDQYMRHRTGSGHLRVSSDITGFNVSREPPRSKFQPAIKLVSPIPIPIPPSFSPIIHPPSEPSPTGRRPPTHSLISLPKDAEDESHSLPPPPSLPKSDLNRTVHNNLAPRNHGVESLSLQDDPPVSPMSTLLVSNAFRNLSEPENVRNSIASHSSDKSFEVPITWVPHSPNGDKDGQPSGPNSEDEPKRILSNTFPKPNSRSNASLLTAETIDSNDPVFPGGWVATPSTEPIRNSLPVERDSLYTNSNPLNGTLQRNPTLLKEPTTNAIVTSSPHIVRPDSRGNEDYDHTRRKSQIAVVSTVSSQTQIPPVPSRLNVTATDSSEGKDDATGSWVIVSHRTPVTGQQPDNDLSTPITTIDSRKSVDDFQPKLSASSAAVHFVNQETNTSSKSTLKDNPQQRKRRKSVISRFFGQLERKEEVSDDRRGSVISTDEKKSPRKSKKLLSGRSRK